MSPSKAATSQCRWGFHTFRGGIDPRDLFFRRHGVGVVEIWKGLSSDDETLTPRVQRNVDVG